MKEKQYDVKVTRFMTYTHVKAASKKAALEKVWDDIKNGWTFGYANLEDYKAGVKVEEI